MRDIAALDGIGLSCGEVATDLGGAGKAVMGLGADEGAPLANTSAELGVVISGCWILEPTGASAW